jgi:hypothetical protein
MGMGSGVCPGSRSGESSFESQRDPLQRVGQRGGAIERVSQFSLGDVGAAQSVALRSRDLQFDVAPEDRGDGPIADRSAEFAPCRVIDVNARCARLRAWLARAAGRWFGAGIDVPRVLCRARLECTHLRYA